MRHTEKSWCGVCRFMTYGCKHEPERRPVPAILAELPRRALRRELALLPVSSDGPIAAFATCCIRVAPQMMFKPRRFVVPADVAPHFDLLDLRVGNVSLFATVGNVPASAFPPPVDESVPLDNIEGMPTVMLGQELIFIVLNRDAQAVGHAFRAMMFGDTVA